MSKLKLQRGDTLVEVTIAAAILSMVLLVCYVLATKAFHLSQAAKERRQVTELMQQQVEYIHSLRNSSDKWSDFVNLFPAAGPTTCHYDTTEPWPPAYNPDRACSLTSSGSIVISHAPFTSQSPFKVAVTLRGSLAASDNTNCFGCNPADKLVFHIHGEWPSAGSGPTNTSDLDFILVNNFVKAN